MSLPMICDEPTTGAERELLDAMPREARILWCPRRECQIDVVVCARMQQDSRPRCQRARRGHCCEQLDASWAEELHAARMGQGSLSTVEGWNV